MAVSQQCLNLMVLVAKNLLCQMHKVCWIVKSLPPQAATPHAIMVAASKGSVSKFSICVGMIGKIASVKADRAADLATHKQQC